MVYEVERNRLIHLFTPLFFGWTISLNKDDSKNTLSSIFYFIHGGGGGRGIKHWIGAREYLRGCF